MSSRRSDRRGWVALAIFGLGCAGAPAPGVDPPHTIPHTIVEASEPAPAGGIDWLGLWTELGARGEAPVDADAARAALCAEACAGQGPYLVRSERDAAIELWVVGVRGDVGVRAPAARVASDPGCPSTIAALEFAEDVGGVALYLAVDAAIAPEQRPGPAACATRRVECQTYIEDGELVAGGPASIDWACDLGPRAEP